MVREIVRMKQQDPRASIVVTMVWLLGMMTYSVWKEPAPPGGGGGIYNALEPAPVIDRLFAD